jgi:hypothetical protein
VDQRKGHAEGVGDGGRALGAACVWADDDGLLVVGDVELDVLAQEVAAIQVVDGDVEEALVLGVWQALACLPHVRIHGDQTYRGDPS